MIAVVWIIVIACGVTARPNATTTPHTHPTTPHTTTTNMSIKPTIPPISHNRPKWCPTKAALIADFISKSKYHFKALQYDHQGYYKALKWNLDMAFISLEGQFGNLMSDVQHDMKDQFANVQKQNDALKSENAALKSELTQNMSQLTQSMSQLTQNMSAVKDEMKTQITALKQQMTDGLKTLTDHVTALNCNGGKWMNGVCYKILKCSNPQCNITTAKQMCNKMGATLAPLRSATIYNLIVAYMSELRILWLWIDGSDAVTDGTWRYHDGTPMSYTKWYPGQPDEGTGGNSVFISGDKMWDVHPSFTCSGVACAWE